MLLSLNDEAAPSPSDSAGPSTPSLSDKSIKKMLLKQERKESKVAAAAATLAAAPVVPARSMFLPRKWVHLEDATLDGNGEASSSKMKIKIMTWNMLAQALVRRELFPGSDFLRVKERVQTLTQELLQVDADIMCLQEVDRLSDHLPSLSLQYSHVYHIGYPDKPHGLLICFRSSLFEMAGQLTGKLDELPIFYSESNPATTPVSSNTDSNESSPSSQHSRESLGLSRSTRNVFLLVALAFKDRPGGIIVGTTHLFWHPTATYERARQTGILFREAKRYRDYGNEGKWRDWQVVLAGDFNTQPNEITYSLLLSNPLLSASQINSLTQSTVVHQSVDKKYDPSFVSSSAPAAQEEQEGGASAPFTDPDKVIRNARPATPGDGMINLEGFKRLFAWSSSSTDDHPSIISAYGTLSHRFPSFVNNCYVDRTPEVHSTSGWTIEDKQEEIEARKAGEMVDRIRRGDFEPKWTNFTPLWRCTLDYIFLLPPSPQSTPAVPARRSPRFTGLLEMHTTEQMQGGLPRKHVGASDHESLGAELEIFL